MMMIDGADEDDDARWAQRGERAVAVPRAPQQVIGRVAANAEREHIALACRLLALGQRCCAVQARDDRVSEEEQACGRS